MDAPLLLRKRRRRRGMLIARTIRAIGAAFPAVPITVATSTIAPPAAMLIAFTLRPRAVALCLTFRRKLMELRRLAARHGWLRRTRLLCLLRRTLLARTAVGPVRARPALIPSVGTSILALPLAIALLRLAITAPLLEPAMLLAIAAASVAAVPPITPSVATRVAIAALLLVAAVVALLLLRLSLDGCWRRRLRGGGGRREEAAEDACQETLCRWGGR